MRTLAILMVCLCLCARCGAEDQGPPRRGLRVHPRWSGLCRCQGVGHAVARDAGGVAGPASPVGPPALALSASQSPVV